MGKTISNVKYLREEGMSKLAAIQASFIVNGNLGTRRSREKSCSRKSRQKPRISKPLVIGLGNL